jgi:diaminopimelate decarboxylase
MSASEYPVIIDGAPLHQIAEQFGTPLYVYGGNSIQSGAQALIDSLNDQVEVYYSLKANPAIAICSLIRQAGVHGTEIASSGELVAALHSGFDPASILFAGPGKTDDELNDAIQAGVGQINAESINEIHRIQTIAQELKIVQSVGVRINPANTSVDSAKIQTSGHDQKFGIEEANAAKAVSEIRNSSSLKFAGIHTMLGSQVLDADELLQSCASTISMVLRIAEQAQTEIPSINFGGGLGVAHKDDDKEFHVAKFGQRLSELVADSRTNPALHETRFMIEPGRILVSQHGFYIARVIDVKESNGTQVAILDGGINHALLPITANQYKVRIINRESNANLSPVTIGGPLCTSADQWRSQVALDDVQIDDLIAMHNAGAYGLTASMTKFLSRETPAEVIVLDGKSHLIRERSEPDDVLVGQTLPSPLTVD